MSKLAVELTALEQMPLAELRERWRVIADTPPPSLAAPLLRRLVAYRLQERRYGGVPTGVLRELKRVAEAGGVKGAPPAYPRRLAPGTRLYREWQDRTIAVEVTEGGYLWEGKTWRSLSEIAKTVTGAHWSGPRFFGLRRRG
jgi:hypothetical protein